MKILFLINKAGDGGSERFVENLAAEYSARGHRCFLGFCEYGPLVNRMEALGAKCVGLNLGRGDLFSAPKDIAELCRTEGIDVIHAQFPRENIYALKSLRHYGRPKVVFTDHLSAEQGLKWRVLNRLYAGRLTAAAAVWDEGLKVLKANGFPSDKICVIHNGTEVPEEPPKADAELRKELGVSSGEFLCCVLSRYSPEKGLDFLLDSLKLLKKKTDRFFCCVICGDGELFGHIKDRVDSEGLRDTVIQAGYREDAQRVLAASQLYLSPSQSEAMSLGLLEAFAAGLPCVVTDAGSSAILAARQPVSGISVSRTDADAFAEAVLQYMEDEKLRSDHAAAAFAKAAEFSRSAMADKYLRLYENGPQGN